MVQITAGNISYLSRILETAQNNGSTHGNVSYGCTCNIRLVYVLEFVLLKIVYYALIESRLRYDGGIQDWRMVKKSCKLKIDNIIRATETY